MGQDTSYTLLHVLAIVTCTCFSNLCTAGPTCYSCDALDNPADCTKTTTCADDQIYIQCVCNQGYKVAINCRHYKVCSVQEILGIHGALSFWSGCEDIGTCSDMFGNPIIGKKRDVGTSDNGRCLVCCDHNLCNNNCAGFVNLALHRPAYQSSIGWNGSANLAVDGNKDQNYYHGSCIHTLNEPYSWWVVDLGKNYSITALKIYNRNDVGGDGRFLHLQVLVTSQNATVLPRDSPAFQVCGNYVGHSSDGNIIIIKCLGHAVGRWLRIQAVDGTAEPFHFCEVEVFGY